VFIISYQAEKLIWWFLEIGVALNHPFISILDWDFRFVPYNPSIFGDLPLWYGIPGFDSRWSSAGLCAMRILPINCCCTDFDWSQAQFCCFNV